MNPIERKRQKRARRKVRSELRSSERQKAKQEQERSTASRVQAIMLIENDTKFAEKNPQEFMNRVFSRGGNAGKDIEVALDKTYFVASEMNPTKDREAEFGLFKLDFTYRNDGVLKTNASTGVTQLAWLSLSKVIEDTIYESLKSHAYASVVLCTWIYKEDIKEKLIWVISREGEKPETPMVTLTKALSKAELSHGTFKILQSRGQAVIPYSVPGKRGYRLDEYQVAALKLKAIAYRQAAPLKAYSKSRETEYQTRDSEQTGSD